MSRHLDPSSVLDPAVAAELDALDAALAGDGAHGAGWTALVTAVREEARAPRPAFRAALDARVVDGFARARPGRIRRAGMRRPAWLGWPSAAMLVPAGGVAAVVAVAAVVVGLASGTGGDGRTASSESTTAAVATAGPATSVPHAAMVAPGVSATAPSAGGSATASAASASAAATSRGRQVERSTSLDLTTDAHRLQAAADGIVRATQELDGVVATSQVDTSGSGGEATFVLRVPSDRLSEAIRRFGALAHVVRLAQATTDVTSAFTSVARRLADARAERRALLAALARATRPHDVASLQARLAGNRAATSRLDGELGGLRRRVALARVDVTLQAHRDANVAPPRRHRSWGPAAAARDAAHVLAVSAGVLLVAGAALAPLVLLGGAVAGGHRLRRRRRDTALA